MPDEPPRVPVAPPDFGDESAAHDRRDVLCFTTAPLIEPIVFAGEPRVRLVTRCDRPRHDVVATLSLVDARGTTRVLTLMGARSAGGDEREWVLALRPIACRIGVGERLRLAISGARFPYYDRDPHTPEHDPATPAAGHVVATVEVWGVELELPVTSSGS